MLSHFIHVYGSISFHLCIWQHVIPLVASLHICNSWLITHHQYISQWCAKLNMKQQHGMSWPGTRNSEGMGPNWLPNCGSNKMLIVLILVMFNSSKWSQLFNWHEISEVKWNFQLCVFNILNYSVSFRIIPSKNSEQIILLLYC